MKLEQIIMLNLYTLHIIVKKIKLIVQFFRSKKPDSKYNPFFESLVNEETEINFGDLLALKLHDTKTLKVI